MFVNCNSVYNNNIMDDFLLDLVSIYHSVYVYMINIRPNS